MISQLVHVTVVVTAFAEEIDDDWGALLDLVRQLGLKTGDDASKLLAHLTTHGAAPAPQQHQQQQPRPMPKPAPKPATAAGPRALPTPVPRKMPAAPAAGAPKRIQSSLERDAAAVAAWEAQRRDVLCDLADADAEYRAALTRAHERYAVRVAAVLRGRGVVGTAAERVLRAEGRAFGGAVGTLAGAVGRALDAEVRGAGSAARLQASVVAIQRAWRWHRYRAMCRDGTRRLVLREKAAREIASSEASYVDALELLVREYLVPLRRGGGGGAPAVGAAQLQDLFLNVEDVLAFSRGFRARLDARMAAFDVRATCVGDLFLAAAPEMAPVYERFVSGFDRSTAVQSALAESSAFARWEDAVAARPALRHLRLNALLIMPVQRVPRYMLLLRELLAHTDAAHPDRAALERALACVQGVADRINEAKRRAEAHERVAALQRQLRGAVPTTLVRPFRACLREGPAVLANGDPCHLFLLTDQLLVTKKPTSTHLLARVGLLGATATELTDSGGSGGSSGGSVIIGDATTNSSSSSSSGPALRIRNSGGACTLLFASTAECHAWATALSDAIAALPGILEKFPSDREQALLLAATGPRNNHGGSSSSGSSGSGALSNVVRAAGGLDSNAGLLTLLMQDEGGGSGSSGGSRPQFEGKIGDIVAAYDEVARLQGEIMRAPVDLRTLFPSYVARLHPDHVQRLRARIDLLGQKLRAIEVLHQRAAALVASEAVFHTMAATLDEGDAPLRALKGLVLTYFPRERVAELHLPRERDPQLLLRFVLYWYVRLCEAWQAVLQLSWM